MHKGSFDSPSVLDPYKAVFFDNRGATGGTSVPGALVKWLMGAYRTPYLIIGVRFTDRIYFFVIFLSLDKYSFLVYNCLSALVGT